MLSGYKLVAVGDAHTLSVLDQLTGTRELVRCAEASSVLRRRLLPSKVPRLYRMSRKQFEIRCQVYNGSAHFHVCDLSANGTLLNGQRLARNQPRLLHDGDELAVIWTDDEVGLAFKFLQAQFADNMLTDSGPGSRDSFLPESRKASELAASSKLHCDGSTYAAVDCDVAALPGDAVAWRARANNSGGVSISDETSSELSGSLLSSVPSMPHGSPQLHLPSAKRMCLSHHPVQPMRSAQPVQAVQHVGRTDRGRLPPVEAAECGVDEPSATRRGPRRAYSDDVDGDSDDELFVLSSPAIRRESRDASRKPADRVLKQWTSHEEERLVRVVHEHGGRGEPKAWRDIAVLFPGRTPDAVRNKFKKLIEADPKLAGMFRGLHHTPLSGRLTPSTESQPIDEPVTPERHIPSIMTPPGSASTHDGRPPRRILSDNGVLLATSLLSEPSRPVEYPNQATSSSSFDAAAWQRQAASGRLVYANSNSAVPDGPVAI